MDDTVWCCDAFQSRSSEFLVLLNDVRVRNEDRKTYLDIILKAKRMQT